MVASNCSRQDLDKTLERINQDRYEGCISFRAIVPLNKKGTRHRFTLKTLTYASPGHRLHYRYFLSGSSHRRSSYACWHVHGYFFDALFEINPEAKIISRGKTITKNQGNWEDSNIGSVMFPVYHSESCECGGLT